MEYFTKLCISWVLVGAFWYANISNILDGILITCDNKQFGEFVAVKSTIRKNNTASFIPDSSSIKWPDK